MNNNSAKNEFEACVKDILWSKFGVEADNSDRIQLYFSISEAVRRMLARKYSDFLSESKKQSAKRICYLSMEFLIGKSLRNNLFNLGILEEAKSFIEKCSFTAEEVFSVEKDAGLGNGGLGRLAASYLDAMASASYRGEGYSILYEYGIFKQYIRDGEQMELPDTWLDSGEVWLSKNATKKISIKIGGKLTETDGNKKYQDYNEIIAEGYDMLVPGYNSRGVALLKLWKATSSDRFDMQLLNDGKFDEILSKRSGAEIISMFLYPPDNTDQGKKLRLIQQYFFVSATVQYVVSDHYKTFRTVDNLDEHVCFHINDTHPALCIPELVRLLSEDYGLSFEKALDIVSKCISYTNHTVMPEALEVWDESMVKELLPRVYWVIKEINKTRSSDIYMLGADEWGQASETCIVSGKKVRMANMSVICSHKVNGVSSLHSEIIKTDLFSKFARSEPDKFLNITNGITYRRWLCQANPALAEILDNTIGTEYRESPFELSRFSQYAKDKYVLSSIEAARYENKKALAKLALKLTDVNIDPDSMFDVQIKRLHEYKRQLLNVLKILTYYCELSNDPNVNVAPKTFIFAAKAAPSYYHAKRIIKLINKVGDMIRSDPRVRDKLQVVFLPDYNVSLAEKIIPAADISEQISLAGKEASGTGNMKFMLNGALTIGTYDGANVEMTNLVGEENIYIFGMRSHEAAGRKNKKEEIAEILREDARLSDVISLLRMSVSGEDFSDIADYLTSSDMPDPYFCIKDYASYMQVYRQACIEYKSKRKHFEKSVINIANAGYFASDRAIEEYSSKIWNAQKIK